MAKKNNPLHVVVVPLSAHGHLIPALMLSHKLVSVGFDVSYMIPEHRLEQIRKQAILRGCHDRVRFRCMKLSDPPADVHQKCNTGHDSPELLQWVVSHSDAERDELVVLLTSFNQTSEEEEEAPGPPLCIISDTMKSWTQDVANELGIPRLVLCPSAVETLLMELYVKALDAQHRIPIRSSLRKENGITPDELELFRLPGMPAIHPDDINSLILDTCIDFYVGNVLRIHEAAGILCSSFAELEPGACSAMQDREINPKLVPFLPVGPLLPDSYLAEDDPPCSGDEKCLEWLDKQPTSSVLYISFGSVGTASSEQVHELALGLEASGHPFLWVLRDEDLPEGFLSRVEGRCLVMQKFAPQLAVLSHRATGGFLTHSGWNSTVESISLGVPIISMPMFGDQRTICRMVVDRLKLGVELRKDGNGLVGREEVERVVKVVMDSEEGEDMRTRATRFRTVARQASESSHGKLKAFVEQVTRDWKVSKQ